MNKITGSDLDDIRRGLALCQNSRVVYPNEKQFIHQMEKKAECAVMMLTEKQYEWLLNIINRVLTDNGLFGSAA